MDPQKPSSELNDVRVMALELDLYRQILETASDAVVTINENHEVLYMNRAAEDLFGYRREEILGGDLSPLIPSEHRSKHRGYLERYLRTRKARLIGHVAELEVEQKSGKRIPVSIAFNVAQAGDGLVFTAMVRDLSTERSLAKRVRHAEALAAIGVMVATVNHEIKSPLALIGGFASQILREEELSPKGEHKVNIILNEVARLEGVLSELRDLTRPTKLEREEVDLAQVVDHVQELLSDELAEKEISLTVTKQESLPPVMADRDRLSQVLINVLNNAVQASTPGSEIELSLEHDEQKGLTLTVRDCGCGISPEEQKKIFKPFFTTKKSGTGLGLPVSQRIVEEHGGKISLSSQPGEGTTVRVSLPPAGPASQPSPERA